MYSEEDASVICESIQELIADKQENMELQAKKLPRAKGGNVKAKAAIAYQELLQILLNFQLQGHQRFLDYFVSKFREFDTDNDGIIDEEGFRKLVATLDLMER